MRNLALSCAKCNVERGNRIYAHPTAFQKQVSFFAHHKKCVFCDQPMAQKELFIRNTSIEVNSPAWSWMPVHEDCSPMVPDATIEQLEHLEQLRLRAKAERLRLQLEEIQRLLLLAQEARRRLATGS